MALFTVQPETFWLHDRASLMASATAFERDSRTVKQVTIPVHGANPQRRPQAPSPARRSQAPCGRRSADPWPWALRAATQGMRDRRTAAPAQAPPYSALPPRGGGTVTARRLFLSSDSTEWINNHAGCRGVSAMTARDGINRLPNAGTIPYGKNGWPWTVGHAPGDTSPTALTTG